MDKKTNKGRFTALIVCVLLIVVFFGLHYALKGSCTGADAIHDYFIMTFLPQLGNAGILFTLLWWFGAPILSNMIKSRKEKIEHDIDESAALKQAAEQKMSDIEAKQSSLADEKKKLEKSYRESAENERKTIAENAKVQASRLREDANIAFELQSNVALQAFKEDIRDRAIERAREDIARRVASDASLRDKLIEQSIASLEI